MPESGFLDVPQSGDESEVRSQVGVEIFDVLEVEEDYYEEENYLYIDRLAPDDSISNCSDDSESTYYSYFSLFSWRGYYFEKWFVSTNNYYTSVYPCWGWYDELVLKDIPDPDLRDLSEREYMWYWYRFYDFECNKDTFPPIPEKRRHLDSWFEEVLEIKRVLYFKHLLNQQISEITDVLLGVDYKSTKTVPYKYSKINMNSAAGQARFFNSVRKELTRKENLAKIQNAFCHGNTAVATKMVSTTSRDIIVSFGTPLHAITFPHPMEKWNNPGLSLKNLKCEDGDVIGTSGAVDLHWKNGVMVGRGPRVKTTLQPVMKKVLFTFETKRKFAKRVKEVVQENFADLAFENKLMVIDAENLTIVATSHRLHGEGLVAGSGTLKEYTDLEEHRLLVVPSSSRNGFDTHGKSQLTYHAKFHVEGREYQHKCVMEVPFKKAPQHYGLVFTFSDMQSGQPKLKIKSLLTVYSIFPTTPRKASLDIYAGTDVDKEDGEGQSRNGIAENRKKLKKNKRGKNRKQMKMAINAVQSIIKNLEEGNMEASDACRGIFQIRKSLPTPGHRHRRMDNEMLTGRKDKMKKYIMKSMLLAKDYEEPEREDFEESDEKELEGCGDSWCTDRLTPIEDLNHIRDFDDDQCTTVSNISDYSHESFNYLSDSCEKWLEAYWSQR